MISSGPSSTWAIRADREFRSILFAAVSKRPREITVDVQDLTFIDSMCVGTLVAARRAALEHDSRFALSNPKGHVLRVLEVSGLLPIMTTGEESAGPEADAG